MVLWTLLAACVTNARIGLRPPDDTGVTDVDTADTPPDTDDSLPPDTVDTAVPDTADTAGGDTGSEIHPLCDPPPDEACPSAWTEPDAVPLDTTPPVCPDELVRPTPTLAPGCTVHTEIDETGDGVPDWIGRTTISQDGLLVEEIGVDVTWSPPFMTHQEWAYDTAGNELWWTIDLNGDGTYDSYARYEYDENNVQRSTESGDLSAPGPYFRFEYDAYGRETRGAFDHDADGEIDAIEVRHYNAYGLAAMDRMHPTSLAVTDADRVAYDALGRPVTHDHWWCYHENVSRTMAWEYGDDGHSATEHADVCRADYRADVTWDDLGNTLSRRSYVEGDDINVFIATWEWDECRLQRHTLVDVARADENVTEYTWDGDRLVRAALTDPIWSYTEDWSYDAQGRLVAYTASDGEGDTTWTYDCP